MTLADPPTFDPRGWDVPLPASFPATLPQSAKFELEGLQRTAVACAISIAILLASLLGAYLDRREPAQVPAVRITPEIAREIAPSGQESQRIFNIKGPYDLESSLLANRVPASEAQAATQAAMGTLGSRLGEMRAVVYLAPGEGGSHLTRLEVNFSDSSGAIVTRSPQGTFESREVAASLTSEIVVRRGEMNDADFYSSAVAAGVTDSLIQTFAQAFVYDFNFQTEIKAGDRFEAAFEQDINASRQPVGPPRLLYASMTTSAKSRKVYRFQPATGEPGWFDGNGRSIKRSFMRTPVDGARITSRFGMRLHPTLLYTRKHTGIDLGADVGTAIYASAGGTVLVARPSAGCAGNMVMLKHDNGWQTNYFHLSRFAPDMSVGLRVEQGHRLGDVGKSGGCVTGPHLHYEVVIDGEKVDPQTIPTEQGEVLERGDLAAFITERNRIDDARSRYAR